MISSITKARHISTNFPIKPKFLSMLIYLVYMLKKQWLALIVNLLLRILITPLQKLYI